MSAARVALLSMAGLVLLAACAAPATPGEAEIAQRIRSTRDATFKEAEDGVTVNRTEAIGALGSAIIANEECYLLTKLMRGLGVVWLEHQARI